MKNKKNILDGQCMKNKATVKKTRGRSTETLKRTVTNRQRQSSVRIQDKSTQAQPKRTKRHFPAV